jgi:hypothetical protein
MAADMVEGATRHSAEVEVMAVDIVEGITAGMAEDIVAHGPMPDTAADMAEVTEDTAAHGSMADMAEDTGDITVAMAIITGDLITEPDSIPTVTQDTGPPVTGLKYATYGGADQSGYQVTRTRA